MKFVHKALGLLLASAALSSCGGGGGDGHGAFEPPQASIITLTPVGGSTTLPLGSVSRRGSSRAAMSPVLSSRLVCLGFDLERGHAGGQ